MRRKRSIKDKRKEASYEHFWHSLAPGLSLGETVSPAKSHQSRTPQGALLSPFWLTAEPERKSTLKQEFRILSGRVVVEPDTSKQAQKCEHERQKDTKGEKEKLHNSGKHYSVFLFTRCWHFLFQEAAGYLWRTGSREYFLFSLWRSVSVNRYTEKKSRCLSSCMIQHR